MRVPARTNDLSLHLIAGPRVVLVAMDWPEGRRGELMGFALYRTDLESGAGEWLQGQKSFEAPRAGDAGRRYSTRIAPVQSFLWGDYSVRPNRRYRYRVLALGGAPGNLTELAAVEAEVRTDTVTPSRHAIYFNRGAVAAQEYARRFGNRKPDEVPNGEALDWLTRGLYGSAADFIARADGPGTSLHVAMYEARYEPVLTLLKGARGRGVDVEIVFDAKENGRGDEVADPREDNLLHLANVGLLGSGCIERKANPSYIAHNKFMVLSRNNAPEAVWTGSTNWSLNGFMGQLNVAHVVDDATLAGKYREFWDLLAADPEGRALRPMLETLTPVPQSPLTPAAVPVFSPQKGRSALDRYIAFADGAPAVMVTFAFSIDPGFVTVLKADGGALRYVLMDGVKGNKQQQDTLNQAVRDMRASPATRVAMGAYIREDALDNWLVETSNTMATHVQFVHTKFLLVDPMGAHPIVVSGSANFSEPSCEQNDENMLVVADDRDVADVYVGEFMRSYAHYAYRDARESSRKAGREFSTKPLVATPAWTEDYYRPGDFRRRQREYFAAP